MNTKILIILIILACLGAGGFFIYRNIAAPEVEKKEIEEEEVLPEAKEKAEKEKEGVMKGEFSFVEGDSESWSIESSEIGEEVLIPSWFRFEYLREGPSLRCRQFGSLENAKNNIEPLDEVIIDYVGTTPSGYSFVFSEEIIKITVMFSNLPPKDYVIYKCEAVETKPKEEKIEPQLKKEHAPKIGFKHIGKETMLLPTNYQTTFPASTDVFFSGFIRFNDPWFPEFISQTHSTIMGAGAELALESDSGFGRNYRYNTSIVHNLGLKYNVWFEPGLSPTRFQEVCPELLDARTIEIDGGRGDGCTNNPDWQEFLLKVAKRSIDYGADGFEFDSFRAPCDTFRFPPCFCEHCIRGFREYLKKKYSTEELKNFGIENIDNFDYGDFIRDLTAQEEISLNSDFLEYREASLMEFYRQLISKIRAHGAALGKDISISVNTAEMMPKYMLIQDETDYFTVEYTYKYPPKARSIPAFKLARSLGKPAYFLPNSGTNAELVARGDLAQLMKIYTAEAYSARGFSMVPYCIAITPAMPGETLPQQESIEDIPPCRSWDPMEPRYHADIEELTPYYDFIYNNEQYYDNLFSASKIAVLVSFPSALSHNLFDDFYEISNLLLNSHLQYDALFAGDDDWIEDKLSLNQLNEYEVVILPNTSYLSDRQVNLLLTYAESGGNIVTFGKIGTQDEKGKEVERGLLISIVEASYVDMPGKEEVNQILKELIQPNIQTNADENVAMIEYWNNKTHSIVIHLINYNYDIDTEHLSSQKNINLEVVLKPELLGKDLSVSYESPDWSGIKKLNYIVSNGSIKFQIPNLDFYGVVSIGAAK